MFHSALPFFDILRVITFFSLVVKNFCLEAKSNIKRRLNKPFDVLAGSPNVTGVKITISSNCPCVRIAIQCFDVRTFAILAFIQTFTWHKKVDKRQQKHCTRNVCLFVSLFVFTTILQKFEPHSHINSITTKYVKQVDLPGTQCVAQSFPYIRVFPSTKHCEEIVLTFPGRKVPSGLIYLLISKLVC